ncbi:hypothetical protein CONCODRAFT_69292 [Conidiobolus coronatus NRRL 28638]|uniref:GIT Spa2 homology (SHD) domain-containing protein n=1 Tax=Conidiobolus coronatus (strain ATCC 28846 / CBS 209.66 / NRRL 28638) TaxID=796925 RepID=A0A137PAN5_CONC2|nr:hypothetical protein CONCODRAFT_69292 [Conidiobolus coronatus NRRL 28638]|eukprot:KXN72078.1 hypothetical protein CONCODRAFT_69292 [Conidiobolus coronatus NRRL 28638]
MTMIDQLGILYNGIKQVIDKNHANTRSIAGKDSKSKLSKLPKNEFLELVTDVYDELIRRKETNNCVPFLPKSSAYHPKRNMVRQKLSTLSQPKFSALAEDVILEITSRFPTLDSKKNQYSPEGGGAVNNNQISNRYEAELTISYKRILELEQALHESQTLNFQAQLKNMESNTLNVDNNDNLKRISILLEQQTKSQESYKKEVEKNRQLSQELTAALSKNQELEAQLIEIKKSRDIYLKTIEELGQKNTILNQKIADIKTNALNSKTLRNIESHNEDVSMSEDMNRPILQHENPINNTNKYLSIITVEMRDNLEHQVALLKEATHANLFKDILSQLHVDKFEYDAGLNPSEIDNELITESKYFNNNLSDALSNLLNMIESYPQSPDQTWISARKR